MSSASRKAFTVMELIFVIVIIGILSAIAVPKFTNTANLAYVSKGKTTLASVRNAIATERQKRVLMGDFNHPITDLCTGASSYVFTNFNADANGSKREILRYPPKSGTSDGQWKKHDTNKYTFYFHDGSAAKSCTFKLNNNRLKATSACPELDN